MKRSGRRRRRSAPACRPRGDVGRAGRRTAAARRRRPGRGSPGCGVSVASPTCAGSAGGGAADDGAATGAVAGMAAGRGRPAASPWVFIDAYCSLAPPARADGPGGGSGWLSTWPTGATGGSAAGSKRRGRGPGGRRGVARLRPAAGAFRLSSIGYGRRGDRRRAGRASRGGDRVLRASRRQPGPRTPTRRSPPPARASHRRILASHGRNQSPVRP